MTNTRSRRASAQENNSDAITSEKFSVIPETNTGDINRPEEDTTPLHEDNMIVGDISERGETYEVSACEQQSDEANDSEYVPWTRLPILEKESVEPRKPTAIVEEVEEVSEQAVNAETMEEEHHKDDKMKLNDESQPVWLNKSTPKKAPNNRSSSSRRESFTARIDVGGPRDDEVSDSLFIPDDRNSVPGIVVHPSARPGIPIVPDTRADTTTGNADGNASALVNRSNLTNMIIDVGGSGTRFSPVCVSSDDNDDDDSGQDVEGSVSNVNADDRLGDDNGDFIAAPAAEDGILDVGEALLSGNDDIGQAQKAEQDNEARVMLQHIITMAYDPRQWAQFIGRNDYKITRSNVLAKNDGHGDAGSLLFYLFHKINDTQEKSYSQTGHINHEDILITLNTPGASEAISAPAVFRTYGGLSRLVQGHSAMTFADLAREVRDLSKDIARDVKYLFLPREAARCFIAKPELDWSFVVLFVITVLSQPELFTYLHEFRYSNDKHFDIYNDQLADLLLKYLRNSCKDDYYKKWNVPDMTPVWKHLREMLEEEYTIADGVAADARGGDNGAGRSDQKPATVTSEQRRKRSRENLEPEPNRGTSSKKGRSNKD